MLISRVVDEPGDVEEDVGLPSPLGEPLPQCNAAEELFELMAKDSKFDPGEDTLTQGDLVLLYKNLDLGTQLMSNATVQQPRANQRVETIVYKGKEEDSDDSDVSTNYSNEDLQSLYLVNKTKSYASSHTLCNKFGNIDMNSSDLTMEYKKKFNFRDPYMQYQLQSLNLYSSSTAIEGIVPTSLLDYICCKRLEDNYNFYMDNIIKYVQHTIEQLKKISNGDYLTERVKEKWREVENKETSDSDNNTKLLATSTSIPLRVERKKTGHKTTWDDIVHSEVDIRSLSRILEKKIVIEIPKLITGSYKIMSKCCVDNLIVSCTKTKVSQESERNDSRVDVVFELKRSNSGHVTSDISSIMIVQTSPGDTPFKLSSNENLPLAYLDKAAGGSTMSSITHHDGTSLELIPIQEVNLDSSDGPEKSRGSTSDAFNSKHKIIELNDSDPSQIYILDSKDEDSDGSSVKCLSKNISADQFSTTLTSTEYEPAKDTQSEYNDVDSLSATPAEDLGSEKSLNGNKEELGESTEVYFDFPAPDELGLSMRRLPVQGTLKEESEEDPDMNKKSQTKIRVKSPYENQSFVIEEKKRKRLLEIRERRERKKLTMQEFCKIVKHKYGKGFAMPQASSSVTKLSITNKSFYNSIYGQNTAVHTKQLRTKAHRRGHKRLMADMGAKKSATGDRLDLSLSSMNSERDSNKKFINRSFYLDEVETEMMNNMDDNDDPDTERKVEEVLTERSNESKDLVAELERLTGLIQPSNNVENVDIADSMTRLNNSDEGTDKDSPDDVDDDVSEAEDDERSGNESSGEESESYNLKSRSKLNVTPEPYEGSHSTSAADVLGSKRSSTSVECRKSIERIYDLMKKLGKTDCFLETRVKGRSAAVTRTNSVTNPCSDSGTSRRHLSTNNSCQSFQTHDAQRVETRSQPRQQPPNMPQRNIMRRYDRNRHGRLNIVDDLTPDATGDPIKTFSKLVHDNDSLANIPLKAAKATEVRPTRNLKMDEPKPRQLKKAVPKCREPYVIPPELRPRKRTPENKVANPRVDRFAKRKIIDIIDEEKEARGEAVRGPSKCRLNALAQPRKTYVQAHIAEVQNKYGRSAISDRLQRLAGGPPPSPVTVRVKPLRKLVPEALLDSSARHPPPATRTADFERARARDAAAAARRHAFDPTEPMSWDVETYVRRLRQRDVSQERSRAPRRQADGAEQELGQTLLAASTLQAISANSSPLRPASNRVVAAPNLSDLTELTESSRTPRTPRSPRSPRKSPDSFQRPRGSCSPNSGDHVTDLFDMTPHIKLKEEEEKDSDGSKLSKSKSNAEMATLEAALYRRRAKSAVHSRLRVKTPRHSLLALQSGDAAKKSLSGTKLVKSSEDIALLKSLTKGGLLEWNFKLKPQVTTVGFAFADFNKALDDKPREHFKSSSSGVTSADAERSAKRSSMDLTSMDRDHSKKASENTKSNTMTSDGMLSQYFAPEISREAKKSEVSACVQADCKEFDDLFGVSLDDDRSIGKIVVHSMKTLVTDAMVDSAKLQASESRPVSSKMRTSGNSVQTVVENAVGYKSVIDVGVGSTESVAFSLSPRQKQPKTENSVQTVDSFCSTRKAINEAERMQRLNDAEPKANSNKTIEYSSSLDILVGLLNEIQTITTCQTNMTNKMSEKGAGNSFNTIFDRTTGRNLNHVLSITSLERMKQLESNASIYSFYVSNDGDRCGMDSIKSEMIQTSCLMDKEVNTSKNGRLVSCTTDVPSKIFYNVTPPNLISSHASTVHQSTSVDSFIVRRSIISLHKYKPVSITEVVTEDCPSNKVHETNMTVGAKKVPSLARKVDESSRKVTNRRIKASYAKPSEWDPLMKMKRDILVAVYSVLVFTVFAALSFPDLMQYR